MEPRSSGLARSAQQNDESRKVRARVQDLLRRSPRELAALLCSEDLSTEHATEMFQSAYSLQPQFDAIVLAYAREHAPLALSRILVWLTAASDYRRVLPGLIEITRCEHLHVRAQAVLLV